MLCRFLRPEDAGRRPLVSDTLRLSRLNSNILRESNTVIGLPPYSATGTDAPGVYHRAGLSHAHRYLPFHQRQKKVYTTNIPRPFYNIELHELECSLLRFKHRVQVYIISLYVSRRHFAPSESMAHDHVDQTCFTCFVLASLDKSWLRGDGMA
jgi:hypothetical protein